MEKIDQRIGEWEEKMMMILGNERNQDDEAGNEIRK